MLYDGKRYNINRSFVWRQCKNTDVDAHGLSRDYGVVIVRASDCPHIADKIKFVCGEIVVTSQLIDPNQTDEYIKSVYTASNAGYFKPRKAKSNSYSRVIRNHRTGEVTITHNYYTVTGWVVIDGNVYTTTDYISEEAAKKVLAKWVD